MDVQIKRGFLDVCVLAAIRHKDSYGYRIVRDLKPFFDISESTLYPILRRLESAGCLSVRGVEHNGRLRKYYHIMPPGRERIRLFLTEWQEILSIYRFIAKGEAEHE